MTGDGKSNKEATEKENLKSYRRPGSAPLPSPPSAASWVTLGGGSFSIGIQLHQGYIRVWRKIKQSAIMQDSHALHLFIYLLSEAQYESEKYSCRFEGQKVQLTRGQVITGRYKLASALGIAPSTIRDALRRLERNYQCVSTKSDNKATIVTIVNWDTYQNPDYETRQQPDNNPTTTRQQPDTKQEYKNKEREEFKNKDSASKPSDLTQVTDFFVSSNSDPEVGADFWDYYSWRGRK